MTCPGLIGGQYAAMGHYLEKKKKTTKGRNDGKKKLQHFLNNIKSN